VYDVSREYSSHRPLNASEYVKVYVLRIHFIDSGKQRVEFRAYILRIHFFKCKKQRVEPICNIWEIHQIMCFIRICISSPQYIKISRVSGVCRGWCIYGIHFQQKCISSPKYVRISQVSGVCSRGWCIDGIHLVSSPKYIRIRVPAEHVFHRLNISEYHKWVVYVVGDSPTDVSRKYNSCHPELYELYFRDTSS